MTTLEAEIKLMHMFGIRRNIIVPNVSDWSGLVMFEADLLILTKSNYATCIEIKVSKADLKNDLKKKHIKKLGKIINGKTALAWYYRNLKHFYYAVPEELLEDAKNQIPSFAGLININHGVVRKPKLISNKKWPDEMKVQLLRLGTMRILNLKHRIKELSANAI